MLLELFITLLLVQSQVLGNTSSEEENDSSEHEQEESAKSSSHEHHWGYHDQQAWLTSYQDCSGKSQSPIDIDTTKVVYENSLPAIKLDGYDLTGTPTLKLFNNGHTLQLALPNSMRLVRGFDQIYLAAQLHFHWGTIEVPGSEHTIDNVHFPAEVHVVHYNSKYPNISVAASKPDGLAVLGAFIGIGLRENEHYEKIFSAMKNVDTEESHTQIPGFNVRRILPNHLEKFYRYTGSLTTPPCFQSVNWTVFNDTIKVSRRQLAALEDTLKAGQNQLLSKNFRAPQLLNGRGVLTSFSTSFTPEGPRVFSRPRAGVIPDEETITKHKTSGSTDGLSRGDSLAIAFGVLFAVTVLVFSIYACRHQKKSKSNSKQNAVYKPANKDEV